MGIVGEEGAAVVSAGDDDDEVVVEKGRSTEAPFRDRAFCVLGDIVLPDQFARCCFEAIEESGGSESVGVVIVYRGGGSWTFAGDYRIVLGFVLMGPQQLAGGGIVGADTFHGAALFLGDGDLADDTEAGPSGADGMFPEDLWRVSGPVRVELDMLEGGVAVGAKELGEIGLGGLDDVFVGVCRRWWGGGFEGVILFGGRGFPAEFEDGYEVAGYAADADCSCGDGCQGQG